MNAPPVDPFWIWIIIKSSMIIAALAAWHRYAWKPLKKHVFVKLSEFYTKVNYISTELKPNGGSSLKDSIDFIRDTVSRTHQRQLIHFNFDAKPMFEADLQGGYVWVNRAYLDLLRYHPDDLTGNGWRNLICEADRNRVVNDWNAAITDRRDFQIRMRLVDQQGRELPVTMRAMRMVDIKGNLLGHFGYLDHHG